MGSSFGELADQLNQAILEAEETFIDQFLIRAEVELPDRRGILRYSKHDCLYGFQIVTGDEVVVPVRKSSLGLRILCAHAIPRLWKACEQADAANLQGLADATMCINDFLASLRGPS